MFSKSKKVKSPSPGSDADRASLPAGAEAALWSIVEVIPDPRNHLALTKDPTAEVRLTREAIDEALARVARDAYRAANPTHEPPDSWLTDLPTVEDPKPAWPTRRSTGVRWSADTAEVRLPSLSAPQTATADEGDATVHPIEGSPAPDRFELPVQRRFARGA